MSGDADKYDMSPADFEQTARLLHTFLRKEIIIFRFW